jgi:hypothetical protein
LHIKSQFPVLTGPYQDRYQRDVIPLDLDSLKVETFGRKIKNADDVRNTINFFLFFFLPMTSEEKVKMRILRSSYKDGFQALFGWQ